MSSALERKKISRKRRVFRIRKSLKGTGKKPRLSVFRSNRHLYAQLIDDENSKTIAAYGTLSKEITGKKSKENAALIGTKIAEMAKKKKIKNIIFDRGRFKYHGLIAELANAARKAGLQF